MYEDVLFDTVLNTKKQIRSKNQNNKISVSDEDRSLVETLEYLQRRIESTNSSLNYATDQILIDSYIYELKALHMKYEYYNKLCKEKGLVAGLY